MLQLSKVMLRERKRAFQGHKAWKKGLWTTQMQIVGEEDTRKALYQSLAKSMPESLKVYGSIFHILHGNPFNLEVLVDSWPDYHTVITRPDKKEIVDKLDGYANIHHIFTKDLQKCQQFLESPGVIHWDQVIRIQGFQESLDESIRKIAASRSLQVNHINAVLFVNESILEFGKNGSKLMLRRPNIKSVKRDLEFKFAPLNTSHAKLVNDHWELGMNEKSLEYVRRCIQNFPAFCLLNSEGNPVSWCVMDQSSELRMSYTLPKYRQRGIHTYLVHFFLKYLDEEGIPFFGGVEEKNEFFHKWISQNGFHIFPRGWNQWILTPK